MPVAARIFHPDPPPTGRPLEAWLHAAKSSLADRQARAFHTAGAEDARVIPGQAPGQSFGARLREIAASLDRRDGLVVMGSGSLALATTADLRAFVAAAREPGRALTNNRYSADVVALGGLGILSAVPDLRADNTLPRWLEETAGYRVTDTRGRWRLGIDLDSPLDVVLVGFDREGRAPVPPGIDLAVLRSRLAELRRVASDPRAELLVAGRTSADVLSWLERRTACRVRALVEERGLRAGGEGAWTSPDGTTARRSIGRPPASVLGALLDRDGPDALGPIATRMAEGGVIDTRVLLAHRLGRDEAAWPPAEDRFASDLLLADRIGDPWLRALTASASAASVPIVLGGHTLVGPGLRLALSSLADEAPRPVGMGGRSG